MFNHEEFFCQFGLIFHDTNALKYSASLRRACWL